MVTTYDVGNLPPSVGRLKIEASVLAELAAAIRSGQAAGPETDFSDAASATKTANAVRRNLRGTFSDLGKLGVRVFTTDGLIFRYAIFPSSASASAEAAEAESTNGKGKG